MEENTIPLLDCPVDYLIGDASGKVMNEYGRYPCKIQCGVYALMVRGSARATINITQYEFRQDDILMLEPGSFLLIHEFSEDALVYYLLFSSSFLQKHAFSQKMSLNALHLASPVVLLNHEQAEVITDFARVSLKALNCTPPMLNSDRMTHIFNLLYQAYSERASQDKDMVIKPIDRRTEIYQEYCQLVLKHYQHWHHVNQYADAMRLTLPHLCSTVKAVSGRTAGDIIIEAILTDAKAQLKITNLQVKEIALSLGFENVAFFNRFFKSHIGLTPKSYRLS